MGRKYGLGKYGMGTYDLGGEEVISDDCWTPVPNPPLGDIWAPVPPNPPEIWTPVVITCR